MNLLHLRFLFILIFLVCNCILLEAEASLQTDLVTLNEARDKISGVSNLRFTVCLSQTIASDFIQTTDYTNYLTCDGKCSHSTYYRRNDVDALFRAILILPCDPNSILLIPYVTPFRAKEFQGKYFGI
ncbi:hypothetical protein EHO59_16835 [Leptospira semungkisensis]|uniref:TIGR04452 family lipoprotein n=1 Tax=Leptospira semungkisensis TaxID=2484985 RepID=A0A4R9FMQ1_9LEPT|nr:hypothetical protein [Leptospira semungkisensis]TGJ99514.1 hypothetical protein EHO59_16835 [Leptospira semungkisensis]